MNNLRFFLPLLSLVLALTTACQGNDSAADGNTDSLAAAKDTVFLPKDDADLHLALTQTLESLPYFYADAHGLFARHGLKVRVHSFAAQFDADTALLGTTAQVGTTDLVRLNLYQHQHRKPLQPIHATNGNWLLIANNKERIKQTSKLTERQVATARYSASDYYNLLALQEAKLTYDDIFHPQVNDYHVRLQMLLQHQVDAAVLPEPFASRAIQAGHTRLYATQEKGVALVGCLAARQDWAKLSASQKPRPSQSGLQRSGANHQQGGPSRRPRYSREGVPHGHALPPPPPPAQIRGGPRAQQRCQRSRPAVFLHPQPAAVELGFRLLPDFLVIL